MIHSLKQSLKVLLNLYTQFTSVGGKVIPELTKKAIEQFNELLKEYGLTITKI